jgi:hypothetical protein
LTNSNNLRNCAARAIRGGNIVLEVKPPNFFDFAFSHGIFLIFAAEIADELGRPDLPILYNLPFGHTSPICVMPYGATAEIDCKNAAFSIMESAVK